MRKIFAGEKLNDRLHDLAVGTPCHCQRRSQCASGDEHGSPFHGFVVSIALVDNLQMTIHSPSEQQLTDRAEGFCRTLEGRWALGDCGNSVIVFVWRHYKKMVIWPARLAEKYVTAEERRHILASVNSLVQNDQWSEALTQVIADLHRELQGEPEDRIDTGTLSLIIAVGVACLLTLLITCTLFSSLLLLLLFFSLTPNSDILLLQEKKLFFLYAIINFPFYRLFPISFY
uniref:Uncharacterized protein n=1 Tax=Ascaris lumbricoides TaxID=6252 RepID=A0A0M3IR53_ASCLU